MILTEQIDTTLILPAVPETPARSSWPELVDALLAMYRLTDDWDGQGAKAPQADLIRAALLLARDFQAKQFAPADRCIAGVNGTLFFEWHGETGEYTEIEVETPETAEVRLVRNGVCTTEILQLPRQS